MHLKSFLNSKFKATLGRAWVCECTHTLADFLFSFYIYTQVPETWWWCIVHLPSHLYLLARKPLAHENWEQETREGAHCRYNLIDRFLSKSLCVHNLEYPFIDPFTSWSFFISLLLPKCCPCVTYVYMPVQGKRVNKILVLGIKWSIVVWFNSTSLESLEDYRK